MNINVKIEDLTDENRVTESMITEIRKIITIVPKEHLIGLDRIVIIDVIFNVNSKSINSHSIPGIYHPKQGTQSAWIEVSLENLLPSSAPFLKRLINKLTYKSNWAVLIFSLIAQHHFLTQRHSIKRSQIETYVKSYSIKHYKTWAINHNKLRYKIFKGLQPSFEKLAKKLGKNQSSNRHLN